MTELNQTILGIDIGSSTINAIIAEIRDEIPHVIGAGQHKSQGLKKGAIVNIELASRAIRAAINDAKRVAGVNCSKAIVSISGTYTKNYNSIGIINNNSGEIGIKEINRAMQTALYNATIQPDFDVIHALPYKFKVNDQDLIDDPMGMVGQRREVFVHIICAPKSSLNNLRKAVKTAGVEVANIVLAGYASAIAVLQDDEKEQGVACIDMGGSTCDLVIHLGNSIQYNDFLAVGSQHITSDLSMILGTPLSAAEEIKLKHGSLRHDQITDGIIEMPTSGDESTTTTAKTEVVYNIIHARTEETLMFLAKFLEKSGLRERLGAGVVLTGGMVKLDGIRELASAVFANMPVRIANPHPISGFFESQRDSSFATVVGLILYGSGHFTNYEYASEKQLLVKMAKFNNEDGTIPNPVQDIADLDPKNKPEQEATGKAGANARKTKVVMQKPKQNLWQRFWQWLTQLF